MRPARPTSRRSIGRAGAYAALDQFDAAIADYQAVVEIALTGEMANVDPMLEASYYSLGSIAIEQGKPADAIPYLEKALAIKRSDADVLYLIGTAYSGIGKTDMAEAELRMAVAFVPIGWSDPYAAFADTFTKAGQDGGGRMGRGHGRPDDRASPISRSHASWRS